MIYFGSSESFSPLTEPLHQILSLQLFKGYWKMDLTKTKFEIVVNTILKISY